MWLALSRTFSCFVVPTRFRWIGIVGGRSRKCKLRSTTGLRNRNGALLRKSPHATGCPQSPLPSLSRALNFPLSLFTHNIPCLHMALFQALLLQIVAQSSCQQPHQVSEFTPASRSSPPSHGTLLRSLMSRGILYSKESVDGGKDSRGERWGVL